MKLDELLAEVDELKEAQIKTPWASSAILYMADLARRLKPAVEFIREQECQPYCRKPGHLLCPRCDVLRKIEEP